MTTISSLPKVSDATSLSPEAVAIPEAVAALAAEKCKTVESGYREIRDRFLQAHDKFSNILRILEAAMPRGNLKWGAEACIDLAEVQGTSWEALLHRSFPADLAVPMQALFESIANSDAKLCQSKLQKCFSLKQQGASTLDQRLALVLQMGLELMFHQRCVQE